MSGEDSMLKIELIDQDFSVCQLKDLRSIEGLGEFCFLGITDEELSLVCPTHHVPDSVTACEHGWRAFRIQGVLEFSLVGILAKLSTLLAEQGVGIFAISTYNTDYILTKAENFERAIRVLERNGYAVMGHVNDEK